MAERHGLRIEIVSIHAPTRGATILTGSSGLRFLFQSTRPRGARHILPTSYHNPLSFNPRAHAGRDPIFAMLHHPIPVSIHAPTRGATACAPHGERRRQVSIHAPTRGATRFRFLFSPSYHVSIHAPTRGATLRHSRADLLAMFQSTRPRGARHRARVTNHTAGQFQSTRPRGARPKADE